MGFTASTKTDKQGIDMLTAFIVDYTALMREHVAGNGPHPGGCDSEWRSTDDLDDKPDPWECNLQAQHAGLHAALIPMSIVDEASMGLAQIAVVAAIWGDEGTVFP